MPVLTAREIFESPDNYVDLLTAPTDGVAERQFLDRKQVPPILSNGSVLDRDLAGLIENIVETISAFANSCRGGGLLVLGISKQGEILGVDHLSEKQRLRLTDFSGKLRNECCQVRSHTFEVTAPSRNILLIYVPYMQSGICETADNERRAWIRHDLQNVQLTFDKRAQLQRDKAISDFESARCRVFQADEIDTDVLRQFRNSFLQEAGGNEYSDFDLLKRAGAVERDQNSTAWITNSGLLFFGRNPQDRFPRSYVRIMKFDFRSDDQVAGLPSVDKTFDGSVTTQLRNIRAFLLNSGFFKSYQRRSERGGFIDEPELPFIAVDEAIVNAVAHRDYAVNAPIEVRLYRDALILSNAGRVIQEGHDVPDDFRLDQTELDSATRNPKLAEWLRMMRDSNGRAFIQLLSEGTKRMAREMHTLGLPAPEFHLTPFASKLVLHSNAEMREAQYKKEAIATTEFANLYELRVNPPVNNLNDGREFILALNLALINRLKSAGWFVDGFRFGRITAHLRGASIRLQALTSQFVRIFPAYNLQIKQFFGRLYLCIDYDVQVRNAVRLRKLLTLVDSEELVDCRALVRYQQQEWQEARVIDVDAERCRVLLFESKQEVLVPSDQIFPFVPTWKLAKIIRSQGIAEDIHRRVKEESLSLRPKASRIRAEKTNATVKDLADAIFPLTISERLVSLESAPVLLPRKSDRAGALILNTLEEPLVRFDHQHEAKDIREGITKFGVYEERDRTIELLPICTQAVREQMVALIERVRSGSFKYKGAERTFKTRIRYETIVTVPQVEGIVPEIARLLSERPEWIANPLRDRLFMVYAPTLDWSADDCSAPYFQAKRLLLEAGIPCQMVNQPTLANPDWKDLNLALNIVAKCGVTPWVLPDAIPDADFFVGLSYTQSRDRNFARYLGYANVFNQFGKWEFYSGSSETFPYEQRAQHLGALVRSTLQRLSHNHSLQPTPSIVFHYSAKFSHEDVAAILAGAREVRPNGKYSFVWLNSHHITRFYDQKPESDGSLQRGGYVITGPNQLYVSTTGFNPYRSSLGTPIVLEANVRIETPNLGQRQAVDHRTVATQILSLTKLNWASTDSLCGEPITTKYAGDIAYLTAAFLRQGDQFKLHPVLESTPWFI